MSATIALRDARVALGGRPVLDGVDLDVRPGEWVNVVGPNGAGKTTLIRVLAGLARLDSGSLTIDGVDVGSLRRRAWAQRVALVPQSPIVPAGMPVASYVLLGRTPHLGALLAEGAHDLDVVREALDQLDLLPFADRSVETLSGGERQRVLVARLLAQQAPIALLDEPTAALDVGHQQQVLDLVDSLRRAHSLTVVATMHDLTVAGQYGDRVVLVVDGRVVADGPPREVLTEATLTESYGARVRVIDDADGPIVVPVRGAR